MNRFSATKSHTKIIVSIKMASLWNFDSAPSHRHFIAVFSFLLANSNQTVSKCESSYRHRGEEAEPQSKESQNSKLNDIKKSIKVAELVHSDSSLSAFHCKRDEKKNLFVFHEIFTLSRRFGCGLIYETETYYSGRQRMRGWIDKERCHLISRHSDNDLFSNIHENKTHKFATLL